MTIISDENISRISLDNVKSIYSSAKEALTKLQNLSDEIEDIRSSLQPLSILLEACCNTWKNSETSGNLIFFPKPSLRSDVEERWVKIFVYRGLIRIDSKGNANITDNGLIKIQKWLN